MALLRTSAILALEALALSRAGPGELMQRAAHALALQAARMLRGLPIGHSSVGKAPCIQVWLGPGNNGGEIGRAHV